MQHCCRLFLVYARANNEPKATLETLGTKVAASLAVGADRSMRIAFIGARGVVSAYSGIETYYEEVGSRLAAMGHEVTAYCRSHFTPPVAQYRGVRVKRLPTLRTKHLETLLHTAMSTVDSLFRHYDLVQFHALGSAPFAFLPRMAGSRTVVSVRGLDGRRSKWGRLARCYLEACEWAALRCPNGTSAVSSTLASYLAERYRGDVVYIPNGVGLCAPASSHLLAPLGLTKRRYVLYVGRLTPEKGCHDLIAAYQACDTDLDLALVGHSTYADSYVDVLKRSAGERVHFLGFQQGDDLAAIFSNAYVYVLPSHIEGLSVSLLEAMAYGNCVLSSDIPENRDIVGDRGVTYRTGDVKDLTTRLQHLLDHPELVEDYGSAAKGYVESHFTWDKIAEQTERFYRNLVTAR